MRARRATIVTRRIVIIMKRGIIILVEMSHVRNIKLKCVPVYLTIKTYYQETKHFLSLRAIFIIVRFLPCYYLVIFLFRDLPRSTLLHNYYTNYYSINILISTAISSRILRMRRHGLR